MEEAEQVRTRETGLETAGHNGKRHEDTHMEEGVCSWCLVSHHSLGSSPSLCSRLVHAILCPPHGVPALLLSYILALVTVWAVAYCILGQVALPGTQQIQVTIHGGTVFALLCLLSVSMALGWLVEKIHLPGLLGMLLAGIALKNIPYIDVARGVDPAWYSATRSTALVVILLRACLGLNPTALRKLSVMVFRLAFLPCLAESLAVAVAARVLLSLPWVWGAMLGFVLAAVSPAVVVSCLLNLQERGYGVEKGIPTLVIAAASMDDVLAISCFTLLLGGTFNTSANLAMLILHGPLEAAVGIVWGLTWGALAAFFPPQPSPSVFLRLTILIGGALLALVGSDLLHLKGAGALAILVMAFTAGTAWRRQGWGDSNPVTETLASLWTFFQPLLFSLIGAEVEISSLEPVTMMWGVLVLVCGLTARATAAFLAVGGANNSPRERLFVALAWLPKATVQAAMGPLARDLAREAIARHSGDCQHQTQEETEVESGELSLSTLCNMVEYGNQLLTVAVMAILITAPLGAVVIMLTGPRLLSREEAREQHKEEQEDDFEGEDGVRMTERSRGSLELERARRYSCL